MTTVAINTRTSGKYTRRNIGGREHIVTTMMPIRGNIAMNSIYYPDEEVSASYMQFNMLPAPNSHPVINGEFVPAFHPVANNAFNIGGFTSNPRKKGKNVFVDFNLDVAVANATDAGKEVIRRIEAGEKIGVSTGLTLVTEDGKGSDEFGKPYTTIGRNYKFDHTAILLNEAAAGEHAGTELILNEGKEDETFVCNLQINELSTSDIHDAIRSLISAPDSFAWVSELYPDSRTVIYEVERQGNATLYRQAYAIDTSGEVSLVGDREEVRREVTYTTNQEVEEMDKEKLVLAIIGNSANQFTGEDKDRLMSMSEPEIVAAISAKPTEEQAKAIMTNAGHDFEGYATYIANKDGFALFLAEQDKVRNDLIETIVANSEMTADRLEGKDLDELKILANMAKPSKATRAGDEAASSGDETVTCNYEA